MEEVRALWHVGYHDGPWSGMAIINNTKLVWFEVIESRRFKPISPGEYEALTEEEQREVAERDDGILIQGVPRIYALYDLSAEEIAKQFRKHDEQEAGGYYDSNYYSFTYIHYIPTKESEAYFNKKRTEIPELVIHGPEVGRVDEDHLIMERHPTREKIR